jgi:hypothetical protein
MHRHWIQSAGSPGHVDSVAIRKPAHQPGWPLPERRDEVRQGHPGIVDTGHRGSANVNEAAGADGALPKPAGRDSSGTRGPGSLTSFRASHLLLN